MTLREIRTALESLLAASTDLPSKLYTDGERFDPKPPAHWMRLEVIGGPTFRLGMTPEGVRERRSLAIVTLGIPDGKGDSQLTDYEDALDALFPSALSVSGALRVRSTGANVGNRERSGPWLTSVSTIPLATLF